MSARTIRIPANDNWHNRAAIPANPAVAAFSSSDEAIVRLVREALRHQSIRDEIRAIASANNAELAHSAADTEPLVDAHAAGRLLGMSAAAVRAAAFRGTLPSHHVGRLLRFRPSELLPPSRAARSSSR